MNVHCLNLKDSHTRYKAGSWQSLLFNLIKFNAVNYFSWFYSAFYIAHRYYYYNVAVCYYHFIFLLSGCLLSVSLFVCSFGRRVRLWLCDYVDGNDDNILWISGTKANLMTAYTIHINSILRTHNGTATPNISTMPCTALTIITNYYLEYEYRCVLCSCACMIVYHFRLSQLPVVCRSSSTE